MLKDTMLTIGILTFAFFLAWLTSSRSEATDPGKAE